MRINPSGVTKLAGIMICVMALPTYAPAAEDEIAPPRERFEVAAWVDHFDFAAIRAGDGYRFDTETAEGCAKILDHVEKVGATKILWRNCAGATMRYQSRVESHHQDAPMDKRRIPDTRPIWGWVRYGDAEPDILRTAMKLGNERGLTAGVHWPFEETHWACWTIGGWNLDHPQFWGRTPDGQPWWGRASLAFDQVVEHKLDLVDELIDRGIEALFIDFFRDGGWSPAYEYVDPVIADYRDRYGADPPMNPKDPKWCRHVSGYVTDYLRGLRQRLNESGRNIELMVGIPAIEASGEASIIEVAADWRVWIDRGIIDTLVINYVRWDNDDPFTSTRRTCREIMRVVDGRCRVLWPVRQYDYGGNGIPSYRKATGLPDDEIAARLVTMAWEEGANGISLECVDYNNYRPATRKAIRELTTGPCKWVQPREGRSL